MSQCCATGDCFKASFQFKLDKANGKVSQTTTKDQWQSQSASSSAATTGAKLPGLGTHFDADG